MKAPLDTIALRKAARLSSPENEGRFNKALADLQADFKLVPVAVTEAGAWHYAFAYDIVARHYPELPEHGACHRGAAGAAQAGGAVFPLGWGGKPWEMCPSYSDGERRLHRARSTSWCRRESLMETC